MYTICNADNAIVRFTSDPSTAPGEVAYEGYFSDATHVINGVGQYLPDEEQQYTDWKKERTNLVSAITVTVDGLEFDGDEISQDRMARAVIAAHSNQDTIMWRLADNTAEEVTVAQLKQALRLAGTKQAELWHKK